MVQISAKSDYDYVQMSILYEKQRFINNLFQSFFFVPNIADTGFIRSKPASK